MCTCSEYRVNIIASKAGDSPTQDGYYDVHVLLSVRQMSWNIHQLYVQCVRGCAEMKGRLAEGGY